MQEKRDTSPRSAFQVEGTQVRQWKLDWGRKRLVHSLSDRSWHYITVGGLYAEAKTDDARQPNVTWNWLEKRPQKNYINKVKSPRASRDGVPSDLAQSRRRLELSVHFPRQLLDSRCVREGLLTFKGACTDSLRHITPSNQTRDLTRLMAMFLQCELISVFERDDEDGEENSSNYISWV